MPLNELGQELLAAMYEDECPEVIEDEESDIEFIYDTFQDHIEMIPAGVVLSKIAGASVEEILISQFVGAIRFYREWLIERGVNVRELEGRE